MRSAWLVSISSAFCVFSFAVLVGVIAGPGCQTRCFNAFDCGPGSFCSVEGRCETECFTDENCREPVECIDNPAGCRPKGLICNAQGKCTGNYRLSDNGPVRDVNVREIPAEIDGWDDPPGTGAAFIINRLAVASEGRGFDVDGECGDDGCVDNYLWSLGDFANDQIQQGLDNGQSLLLVELAGLDQPFVGNDRSLSLKVYSALDADSIFFAGNNFQPADGQSGCCEFRINPKSLGGFPRVARARAPAEIDGGRIRSLLPVTVDFVLAVGSQPHPEVRLERVKISGRVTSDLQKFSDGLLGGAVPVNNLAQIENPYCITESARCPRRFNRGSTMMDLVSFMLSPRPDIDLDGDGLECVFDTDGDSSIDTCCNGDSGGGDACPVDGRCPTDPILPLVSGRPDWQCALNPNIADGYSLAFTFTAVAASIVGIGR